MIACDSRLHCQFNQSVGLSAPLPFHPRAFSAKDWIFKPGPDLTISMGSKKRKSAAVIDNSDTEEPVDLAKRNKRATETQTQTQIPTEKSEKRRVRARKENPEFVRAITPNGPGLMWKNQQLMAG